MKEKFSKILNENYWEKLNLKLQDEFINQTFQFFNNENIKSVCLPVTTGSVTSPMGMGSDSLPVKVNLFETTQYLADSMQFHLEYLLRLEQKGVHYIMPTFRGEETDKRHLAQFYHSEAEIIGNLQEIIFLVNKYITYLSEKFLEKFEENISQITGDVEHIKKLISLNHDIPQIKFEEAFQLLNGEQNNGYFEYNSEHDFYNITPLGEQRLMEEFDGIVWLTHFNYKAVPFYQRRDGKSALNADLLIGIGEIAGCGERCYNIYELDKSMDDLKIEKNNYLWYREMKQEKPMLTSGFGLGMERYMLWLLKHDDIRDIQLIPRVNGKVLNP